MGRRDSQGDMARGYTIRLPWLRYRYGTKEPAIESLTIIGMLPNR